MSKGLSTPSTAANERVKRAQIPEIVLLDSDHAYIPLHLGLPYFPILPSGVGFLRFLFASSQNHVNPYDSTNQNSVLGLETRLNADSQGPK